MLAIFGVLIILSSIILGLIVLIQNPKGGGLSGSLGGFSNQLMGVKQTTDVLEKGTWVFAAVVAILCLISPAFIPEEGGSVNDELRKNLNAAPAKTTNSKNTVPLPAAGPDSPKQ